MSLTSFNRMRRRKAEADKIKALEEKARKQPKQKEEIEVAQVQENPNTEGEIVQAVEQPKPVEEQPKTTSRRRNRNN